MRTGCKLSVVREVEIPLFADLDRRSRFGLCEVAVKPGKVDNSTEQAPKEVRVVR